MDFFKDLTMAPGDPILKLMFMYRQDPNPSKVDLSVGVYFDENGQLVNFEAINTAQKVLADYFYNLPADFSLPKIATNDSVQTPQGLTTAYLPASGYPPYNKLVRELLFTNDLPAVKEGRVDTLASVAGSGGLSLAGHFAKLLGFEKVLISDPAWSNYYAIFGKAGLNVGEYRYYDASNRSIDIEGCLADLAKADNKTVILFQTACHNPSGYDFTPEQWKQVLDTVAKTGAFVVFDFAYQGFGRGLDEDAFSIRYATEVLKEFLVVSSCSKNFGLYGERVGAVSIVGENSHDVALAYSTLKDLANNQYVATGSNGEYIVATVLSNPSLKAQWESEVNAVRNRIQTLRQKFADAMKALGFDFDFVTRQNGMFSYTGLTQDQVLALRDNYSIYMVENGRMNVVGLNDKNLEYVTKAFADVLTNN